MEMHSLSGHQVATLKLISICKTAALGGHCEQCVECGYSKIHYNSCGNRNCPNCQGVNKEQWIINRQYDLLPVNYFHSVFTIPSQLYIYFRYNKKILYDLLLKSVKDTLLTFGLDPKHKINGKIGAILVLHTWTQQITFHPHVHCIVPAGGISNNKQWKNSKAKGGFLFPVKALAIVFRAKLMHGLNQLFINNQLSLSQHLHSNFEKTKNLLFKKKWVVYTKKAFAGPQQVLEYIGRYTHKICISNFRILKISDSHVTFSYLDRNKKIRKSKTINGTDFVKLFAEHILPKGFVKIRHIGFLASRCKKNLLSIARKCLGAEQKPKRLLSHRDIIIRSTGKDPYKCPCCFHGEMAIVQIIPKIRGSPCKPTLRSLPKDRLIIIRS